MDNDKYILSATNVHREFETPEATLPVLRGVFLNVGKQETVSVTGASGVGKSTLLHILGGLDRPTGGEVEVGGFTLNGKSEKELARFRTRRVGFVFQHHYLMSDFTALENVMIPAILSGSSRGDARAKGELLLQKVGLIDRRSHRPGQLSGGEQQRVAVARALANDPEIVLADEPSGNLDTATGRRLHDLLFELKTEKSMAFLIATHNQELAERCDRQLKLVEGKVVS